MLENHVENHKDRCLGMGFAVGGYGVATVLKIVQYSPTMPSLCGWGGFLKTFFSVACFLTIKSNNIDSVQICHLDAEITSLLI